MSTALDTIGTVLLVGLLALMVADIHRLKRRLSELEAGSNTVVVVRRADENESSTTQ